MDLLDPWSGLISFLSIGSESARSGISPWYFVSALLGAVLIAAFSYDQLEKHSLQLSPEHAIFIKYATPSLTAGRRSYHRAYGWYLAGMLTIYALLCLSQPLVGALVPDLNPNDGALFATPAWPLAVAAAIMAMGVNLPLLSQLERVLRRFSHHVAGIPESLLIVVDKIQRFFSEDDPNTAAASPKGLMHTATLMKTDKAIQRYIDRADKISRLAAEVQFDADRVDLLRQSLVKIRALHHWATSEHASKIWSDWVRIRLYEFIKYTQDNVRRFELGLTILEEDTRAFLDDQKNRCDNSGRPEEAASMLQKRQKALQERWELVVQRGTSVLDNLTFVFALLALNDKAVDPPKSEMVLTELLRDIWNPEVNPAWNRVLPAGLAALFVVFFVSVFPRYFQDAIQCWTPAHSMQINAKEVATYYGTRKPIDYCSDSGEVRATVSLPEGTSNSAQFTSTSPDPAGILPKAADSKSGVAGDTAAAEEESKEAARTMLRSALVQTAFKSAADFSFNFAIAFFSTLLGVYLRSVYIKDREWMDLPRRKGLPDGETSPDRPKGQSGSQEGELGPGQNLRASSDYEPHSGVPRSQKAFRSDLESGLTESRGVNLGQYLRIAMYVWLLALVLSIAKDLIYQYFVSAPATSGDSAYLNRFLQDFVNDTLPRRLLVQTAYAGLVAAFICYCLDLLKAFEPPPATGGGEHHQLGADARSDRDRDTDIAAAAPSVRRIAFGSAFLLAFVGAAVIATFVTATLLATAAYSYYNELVALENGRGVIELRVPLLLQQALGFFFFALVYAMFVLRLPGEKGTTSRGSGRRAGFGPSSGGPAHGAQGETGAARRAMGTGAGNAPELALAPTDRVHRGSAPGTARRSALPPPGRWTTRNAVRSRSSILSVYLVCASAILWLVSRRGSIGRHKSRPRLGGVAGSDPSGPSGE